MPPRRFRLDNSALSFSAWEDLPVELIAHIASYLPSEDSAALSCTSRHIHAIVEPCLYRYPVLSRYQEPGLLDASKLRLDVISDEEEELLPQRLWEAKELEYVQLRCFTHAIIRRPSLARHIRALDVTCAESDPTIAFSPHNLNAPVDEKELASGDSLFADAAAANGLSRSLIHRGGVGGILVLLLHYLPRLRSLSIIANHHIEIVALAASKQLQGGVPSGLAGITHLEVVREEAYRKEHLWFGARSIVPLMRLPHLMHFTVSGFTEDLSSLEITGRESGFRGLPEGMPVSSLKSLWLEEGDLAGPILFRIMQHIPRLENFYYESAGRASWIWPLSSVSFGHALSTQSQSLTHLRIVHSAVGYATRIDETVLGSLTEFNHLEVLELPVVMLLGRPSSNLSLETIAAANPLDGLLPPSIRRLHLHLLDYWLISEFISVTGLPNTIHNTKETLPCLQRFRIDRDVIAQRDEIAFRDGQKVLKAFPDLITHLDQYGAKIVPVLGRRKWP